MLNAKDLGLLASKILLLINRPAIILFLPSFPFATEKTMASNRSRSSKFLFSSSKKKRRKSDKSNSQYGVLEPRQLLAGLLITEFVASNSDSYLDDSGNSTDWIELYNDGPAINLAGYSLTDDPSNPTKFVFSNNASLGASQYLVVIAGDDASPDSGTDIYTGFGLSSSGEYLGLFDPSGAVLSEFGVGGADYPTQYSDVSYGVEFGGNFDQVSYFATPTPGAANTNAVAGVVERVDASVTAGFYDTNQSVSLSTPTSGSTIRYTTDGSTPSATNGFTYTGPISISGTTNLRAVGTRSGYLSVPDRTWSYIFVDDVLQQSNDGSAPAGFPAVGSSSQVLDYGIDPDVIGIEGAQAVRDALLSISTISITTDVDNLFDPNTGIYVNALEDGIEWERPASVELLQPDGSEGFQVNAGLRIRGGFSRLDNNAKHSFRVIFRSEYGDSELNYPIHGDSGTDTFDKLDFRTAQNYSWSKDGDANNNFIQDVISRQNQGLTGQPYTRSSWQHLYLNGQYWGLFQTQERIDSDYAASYFGGEGDDYDVIKVDAGPGAPRTIFASDGNLAAFNDLAQQTYALDSDGSTPNFVNDEAYLRVQGLNLDGTRNESYDVLLDVDNLIDYMTEIFYSGNFDAPITNFGGNTSLNNWQAIFDRSGDEGFQYFVHDAEHSLRTLGRDRTGPYNNSVFDSVSSFNPQTLHQRLMANAEYRLAFADSIQEKFFNDGIYTTENIIERWDAEAAKISSAIIAESARWGDARRSAPLLKSDWERAVANVRNNILANRNNVFLEQLRDATIELRDSNGNYSIAEDAPLFPSVDAPNYLVDGTPQHGGEVAAGATVTLTANDSVFYTTDGSDPRAVDGTVSSTAVSYDPAVVTTNLFGFGSTWNYLDTGDDEGTAWRSSSFDDSTWETGVGQFGYGNNGEQNGGTEIDFGGVANNKHVTTYFRKTFNVPAGNIVSATLNLIRDDAVVVFLDGVEIGRNNFNHLPANAAIEFDTLAGNVIGGGNETTAVPFPINLNSLQPGSHTLAIEVHQVNRSSSDLSFDAELEVSTQASGSGALVLNSSTNVQSRTFSNGEWSALSNAIFAIPSSQADVRISEIYYNPSGLSAAEIAAGFDDNDEFEFVEILNPNSIDSISLAGLELANGVTFSFPAVELGPGERAVVVENLAAFNFRYGNNITVLGQWAGGLSNSGEKLELVDSLGQEISSVTYNDSGLWSVAANGEGASLVLDSETISNELLGKYYSWRASVEFGGTPGAASVDTSGVVINEIVAHTDLPDVDSIELFNPTGSNINISGWFLSDSGSNLFQYQIPSSTILSAGGYLVFDQNDFNFALSSLGEEVYLTRSVNGLPAFEDVVEFGATFNGDSVGRLPNGSGRLAHIDSPTLGAANQTHGVSDLIISEVHYNPLPPVGGQVGVGDNDIEFVEVYNRSNQAIDLSQWRLRGDVDFDFPQITLQPGESIPVLAFDPADSLSGDKLNAFRTQYGISASVPLVGGFTGDLGNSFGRVSLQQADTPPADAPTITPWVTVDELVYDDLAPFANADNTGLSLNRITDSSLGNDASSWAALTPTPGSVSIASSGVAGRYVFYNGSSFDGNNSAASASDDLAIADKTALLPGETATFENYTSYVKGINGLFIDLANLGSTALTASDFGFSTGNGGAFQPLGVDPVITVRAGAGVNGSDRVSVIFPDGSVAKTWLQVTVKANAATGLLSDDVFYFGNVVGETGSSSGNALVNLSDVSLTRRSQSGFGSVGIDSRYDFDRNGRVNLADLSIARTNQSGFSAVQLITAPSAGSNAKTFSASSLISVARAESSALSFALPFNDETDEVGVASTEEIEIAPIAKIAGAVEGKETSERDVVFSLPSFFELSDFETQEDEELAFDDVAQQRRAMYDDLLS